MKIVFIAHPLSGDIEGNIKKVIGICAKVHTNFTIPVAPYLGTVQYLNDEITKERNLGIKANSEYFYRGFIDELWLFGDHISKGMKEEIELAKKLNIPIIPKTKETKKELNKNT